MLLWSSKKVYLSCSARKLANLANTMYYMTLISKCLGMLKPRKDKLVCAKDVLKNVFGIISFMNMII